MSNFISRLSDTCRRYAGCDLIARSETGWGWTQRNDSGDDEFVYDCRPDITNSYFMVTHLLFFPERPITRGFTGLISDLEYPLNGERIIAFPMFDGDDFNFSDNICTAWRFLFGNGELDLTNLERPSMKGNDVICGYGIIAAEKAQIEAIYRKKKHFRKNEIDKMLQNIK